jgi:hypothetical protein
MMPGAAAASLLNQMKERDSGHAPAAEQQWQIRARQSVPTKENRRRSPRQRQCSARETNPDTSLDHPKTAFA